MANLFSIVFITALILFIIGLNNPNKSLWWLKSEKTASKSKKYYGILMAISLFLVGSFSDSNNQSVTTALPTPPIDTTPIFVESAVSDEDVKKQFSAWDGSHYQLTKAVKNAMNDPSSFEHVQTTYSRKDEVVFIRMTYRGKNGFGALMLATVLGQVDANSGEVLSVQNLKK